jgi:hypothetical protein
VVTRSRPPGFIGKSHEGIQETPLNSRAAASRSEKTAIVNGVVLEWAIREIRGQTLTEIREIRG